MISEFIMFDSDSDSELEQVSSLTSSPESFDLVPKNIDYKIKLFGPECSKKGISFLYTLKEGKELPYSTKTVTKKAKGWLI